MNLAEGITPCFSQVIIVHTPAPIIDAKSFNVRSRSFLSRLRSSPNVLGSPTTSCGYCAVRRHLLNGKKATRECRCGRAGEPGFACGQGKNCVERYQSRVSGPLLDRIDIQIEVPAVTASDLVLPAPSEGSAEVCARVTQARKRQAERFGELETANIWTNAACSGRVLEEIAAPDQAGQSLLREAAEDLGLSARGYHRTLRVARTLADLDGVECLGREHIAEALSYRGETLQRLAAA